MTDNAEYFQDRVKIHRGSSTKRIKKWLSKLVLILIILSIGWGIYQVNKINSEQEKLDLKRESYYHNLRGWDYSKSGDFSNAISEYTKALELDPDDAMTYFNRGLIYYSMGDYHRAISDFSKTIELNPNRASTYYNRGLAFEKLGKTEESHRDIAKANELRYNT